MDLLLIFISGLTLGGLTCSIIQIGLFSSLFAQTSQSKSKIYSSVSIYLLSRILGAVIIGLGLGTLGRSAILSGNILYGIQMLAGLIMLMTAISFLPIKRFKSFGFAGDWGIGRGFSRIVQGVFHLKHQWIWVPLFFGLVSFFIPCGATLAIEAQALASGSPLFGSLALVIFVIGTIPVFLGISIFGKFLSVRMQRGFYALVGVFLLILGLVTINGVLVLLDSPVTLQKMTAYSPFYFGATDDVSLSGEVENGVRVVQIDIDDDGYNPTNLWVSQGEEVKLSLRTNNVYNCASVFRIPALGISRQLPSSGVESIAFKPQSVGDLYFSCSTGLKTGIIHVVS